jgi:hypothetical protein
LAGQLPNFETETARDSSWRMRALLTIQSCAEGIQ